MATAELGVGVPPNQYKFSSREVFVSADITFVNLRIPVVEGLQVQLQNSKTISVKFLPPVEIRITKLQEPSPFLYEGQIACPWLMFKKLRKLAVALDDQWDPETSFNDNLEALLHSLVLQLPEKLAICDGLDLTRRNATQNSLKSDKLTINVAVSYKRRSPGSTQPKHILVKTVVYQRKSFDVTDILKSYDIKERFFYSSIPGSDLVVCPIQTKCNGAVLPTRAFRSAECEVEHTVCYRCLVDHLQNSNCLPTSVEYQCFAEYSAGEMYRLAEGLPDLYLKVKEWSRRAILSETVRSHCLHKCPWCGAKVFPIFYVNELGITLCKICDFCFCCKVMLGKELFMLQNTPQFLKEIERYSNEYLQEKIAAQDAS
ncbi:Protein ANKUB1 [Frankliniella fusca]|uniref:Protein ANKUB1 n=1 Tax=Frankliniella fusca TaxID=407009 RepID=A0AAE1HX14_9NEOP|nr:Protein ANKUB1 [Frankliniella fusca]